MPESEDVQVFSSQEFINDPVMFGGLMDFQYGTGEESEDAEDLLEKASRGIACSNLGELTLVLNDLDFWVNLGDVREEPLRYRLYMNGEEASLYAATLLQAVGCEFEPRVIDKKILRVHGRQEPVPIFVDLKSGLAVSLPDIKNFCRQKFLPEQQEGQSRYIPIRTGEFFMGTRYYSEANELVFRGVVEGAPLPTEQMLKENWYVQRAGLQAFSKVLVWDIGEWSILRKSVDEKGFFVHESPPAVLMPDEVRAFEEGSESVVVDEHGCMYCVIYDAYFHINGHLYRIYACMID